MARKFAIGDIHGCCKTFEKLLFKNIKLRETDILYCVGDYIDRGNDSKGVIDLLMDLTKSGYNINTLRGNHEQMLLDAREDDDVFMNWVLNGGDTTLKSFGISSLNDMPDQYIHFLKSTEFILIDGNYIIVHAGLNFNAADPIKDFESMLWIRHFTINEKFLNGRTIIHGHTPKPAEFILSQNLKSEINIDGGCVYNRYGLATLFAFDMKEKKLIGISNCE